MTTDGKSSGSSAAVDGNGDLVALWSGPVQGGGQIVDGQLYVEGATPVTASQFGVSAPASVTADAPFNVNVSAQDASGNTAFGFNGTVTLTDSNGNSLGDVTLTNGVGTLSATFNATGSYTLSASGTDPNTGNTLTGSSNAINVYGQATQLVLSGIPAGASAGAAFTVIHTFTGLTLTAQRKNRQQSDTITVSDTRNSWITGSAVVTV